MAAFLGFISLIPSWWFFSVKAVGYELNFNVHLGWFGGNLGNLIEILNEVSNKFLQVGVFNRMLNDLELTLYLIGGGAIVVLVGAFIGGNKGRANIATGAVLNIIGIYNFYNVWTGSWARTGLPVSGSGEYSLFGMQLVEVNWGWTYGIFIAIFASVLELVSIIVHPSKVELVAPPGIVISSLFYATSGVWFLSIVNVSALLNVAILAVLSLITACGLFHMKKWSIWLVVILFFLGTTFGATTLYNSVILQTFEGALLFHTALIVYMIMLLTAFVYVAAKREKFE